MCYYSRLSRFGFGFNVSKYTSSINCCGTQTLATAKALEFAIDLGFSSVILKGDSEILVKSLMDDSLSLASFGLLIQDVKTYAKLFQCISFSHVCREGNDVAHNLARHSCHVTGFSMWMEDVSSHTFAVYQADLLLLNKICSPFLKKKKKK